MVPRCRAQVNTEFDSVIQTLALAGPLPSFLRTFDLCLDYGGGLIGQPGIATKPNHGKMTGLAKTGTVSINRNGPTESVSRQTGIFSLAD